MDSLSQVALGASVTLAVMGRRSALWKSALVGGAIGTVPDLDVVIDYGDAVLNMVQHRADSHALFWLTLAGPPLGALIAVLLGERAHWRRWALAVWLALFTHPLLDFFTVYGTQLFRPFSSHPYGLGSVFIIDPLYTLPLLVGLAWSLAGGRLNANRIGLLVSTAYLCWGVAAQQFVTGVALRALAAQGIAAERVLVTPTAFNTVLWRVVAVTPGEFHEGYYSLLDATTSVRFDTFDRGAPLIDAWRGHWAVQRIAAFSHGFYRMQERDGRIRLADLRMGQEPFYSFDFDLAAAGEAPAQRAPVSRDGRRVPFDRGLPWLGRRLLGDELPPPR